MYPEVKVCGITREEEAGWISEAGVRYAGFVLYEKSKRYVTISRAEEIFKNLNQNIIKVAVAVSPDSEEIEEISRSGFDIIQVHGELKQDSYLRAKLPIWRAFQLPETGITAPEDFIPQYGDGEKNRFTALLADAKAWGSGKTFGWERWETDEAAKREQLEHFLEFRKALKEKQKQFILAGGLDAKNVADGIRLFAPDIVDVSTGVEAEDGKDRGKILAFMEQVRRAAVTE